MNPVRFLLTSILLITILPVSLLAASGEVGEGWGWIETTGRWFNLLILGGVLFYFLREPLLNFFSGRRKSIREEITEARRAKQEAEEKLAAMEARIRNLDAELEAIQTQAQADAEKERRRIIEAAEKEAAKILETARREIGGLTSAARQDLKACAGRLSIELAEKQIRKDLDPASEKRIVDRFFIEIAGMKEDSE